MLAYGKARGFVFWLVVGIGGLSIDASSVRGQCVEGCFAIHTFVGESQGDQFGWVSNDIGDVDNDGIRDLILTAPTNDAGGSDAGRVYVFSGATGDELFRVTGVTNNEQFGHDAGGAGDFDQDGTPDVIVGAPFAAAGRASVYSGIDGAHIHTFIGEAGGDRFGFRVWGGGDFDGDGLADVVIGASFHDAAGSNAGRAYVYSGLDQSLICAIDGQSSGDLFGSGVAFVGDVTGDGRDDIVVGAQNAGGGGGRAYVYSFDGTDCNLEYELAPGGVASNFGLWFMNGGHDVNGDGTPDIYISDFAVNRAHVFSGVDGALIWELTGDGNGGFGIGRIVPDLDGDLHADLLLAAWASNAGAPQAGKAFVYSGRTGLVLETFTHDVAGATFGFDANGMGDVNGDGRTDHLVTAAWTDNQTGKVFLISGNITPIVLGDGDDDGDVDLSDYSGFAACVTGPGTDGGPGNCDLFDIDFDSDVDLSDFAIFQRMFTGDCGASITQQPQDLMLCIGDAAVFEVAAEGASLTYQWHLDGRVIDGANKPILIIDPVTQDDLGAYTANVAGECAVRTSDAAQLDAPGPAQFLSQPEDISLCLGEAAMFSVVAEGLEPFAYQWQHDGVDIPGATESSFSIADVQSGDLGEYRCVVTDDCGQPSTSDAGVLMEHIAATIDEQPEGGSFCVGDNIFLFVGSFGAETFQWFKDGEEIPGETGFFMSILDAGESDSGAYSVEAFGLCNSVTSDEAIVDVIPCTSQP